MGDIAIGSDSRIRIASELAKNLYQRTLTFSQVSQQERKQVGNVVDRVGCLMMVVDQ
jgi:hypothetical protein